MKFSDISKPSKDLLSDDYSSGTTLKVKSKAGPVAVTVESDRDSMGSISSKIGTKFTYAGLSFDKLQFKADGSNVLETSIVPCPGCKMTFKSGKGADLGVEYTTGGFTSTGTFDILSQSKISASTCGSVSPGINAGADVSYGLSGKMTGLTSYNVGASYASGPLFASATTASKLSQVNVGLLYKVNSDLSLASSTSHSGSSMCSIMAVGGAYTGLSQVGTVKAKVDSKGVISATLVKDLAPKVSLTASVAISEGAFVPGFGITM